jgi:hypothetical protein
MTTERRRYFRIEDRALIKYRVVAEAALEDERRFIFLDEIKSANLHAALMGLELKLQDQLDVLRSRDKAVAEALELINRKTTLLERVVALESSGDSAIDYREHEPTRVSLSGGGIGLEAPAPLDVDTCLAIDLVLLPSNHSMRVLGRVVDCRGTAADGYAIAVEFEDIREQDRDVLIQHIVRKQSAVLRDQRSEQAEDAA